MWCCKHFEEMGFWGHLGGFMERKCWNVLCLILLYPTSKGKDLLTKINQLGIGTLLFNNDLAHSWSIGFWDKIICDFDALRSRVLCCILRNNKIVGLEIGNVLNFPLTLGDYMIIILRCLAFIRVCRT